MSDTPQRTPLEWHDWHKTSVSKCGIFAICGRHGSRYDLYYFDQMVARFPTLGKAKQAAEKLNEWRNNSGEGILA